MDIRAKKIGVTLSKLIAKRDAIEEQYDEVEKKLNKATRDQNRCEKARAIIQHVALTTQEQLKAELSQLASMALSMIFEDPYEMDVAFEAKHGGSRAALSLTRGELAVDPMTMAGGGVVDIVSFALRVTFQHLQGTRELIVLDEPFRFLSKDHTPKAAQLLKDLSEEMGIQFVVITHEPGLAEFADRVFTVKKQGDESIVTV